MAQRVMIAMALACEPELLIADEPTTALDVTIQAQILDLIRTLQRETNTAMILITHDLGVVAEMCDRVAVMYAGEIVEEGDVAGLFADPRHPYTRGLIGSVPRLGEDREELSVIPGQVPNLIDLPAACRFSPHAARPVSSTTSSSPSCSIPSSGRSRTTTRHAAGSITTPTAMSASGRSTPMGRARDRSTR